MPDPQYDADEIAAVFGRAAATYDSVIPFFSGFGIRVVELADLRQGSGCSTWAFTPADIDDLREQALAGMAAFRTEEGLPMRQRSGFVVARKPSPS